MLTTGTTRTVFLLTLSRRTVMSRGVMSVTITSAPLGTGTSLVASCSVHCVPVIVSGTALVITCCSVRSFSSSLPRPDTTTAMGGSAACNVRPGGSSSTSRAAKDWVIGCCSATATYSRSDRNRAANLMGQFRVTRSVSLLAMGEPFDERFVHRAVPFGGPDHLLHNDAFPVDHEALRDGVRLISVPNRTARIVQDVERQAQPVRERHDSRGRLAVLEMERVAVDAHRDDAEISAREPLVQAFHGRHFDPARRAPGRNAVH